jgi:ubiquinone/menaquinone biosynthesis C-methylase UbiE
MAPCVITGDSLDSVGIVPRAIAVAEQEYRVFPNVERRNLSQSRIEIPLFVRALRLPHRVATLEVGCGRGVALSVLHRLLRPSRLAGVDVDGDLLREARQRAIRLGTPAEIVQSDVRSLPFPAGSFDLVIDFGTCFHIARGGAGLQEIARVLVAGGTFATETKMSQILSHPFRSRGRSLALAAAPRLTLRRHALQWASLTRSAGP